MDTRLQLTNLETEVYKLPNCNQLLTPALAIFTDVVDRNIKATISVCGGDPDRWRPHIKTAKLPSIVKRLMRSGLHQFKCATTLELLTLCRCGARDVMFAYPAEGNTARRLCEIARAYPQTKISALIERESALENWIGREVGLFIDVNPGMNRTGIGLEKREAIMSLATEIIGKDTPLYGIHCYEGHLTQSDFELRKRAAMDLYALLLEVVNTLVHDGIEIKEVITSGTPAFPCAIQFPGFAKCNFKHEVSPGTVVYGDLTSLSQLRQIIDYAPAAVVVSRVVSQPTSSVITCDAGHKTLSVDRGIPNCTVMGYPAIRPLAPSEEHLPLDVSQCCNPPRLGDVLCLIPAHICPTVNNFDHAVVVTDQSVEIEEVTARGRERPDVLEFAK